MYVKGSLVLSESIKSPFVYHHHGGLPSPGIPPTLLTSLYKCWNLPFHAPISLDCSRNQNRKEIYLIQQECLERLLPKHTLAKLPSETRQLELHHILTQDTLGVTLCFRASISPPRAYT